MTRWTKAELEAALAGAERRIRSLEVLLERAEADRDTALGRLATASVEVASYRHLPLQCRADVVALKEAPAGVE